MVHLNFFFLAGILIGHREGITYISPKGDGRYLLSNGKDQSMKLWDIRTMTDYNKIKPNGLRKYHWDYRNGTEYPGVNEVHPNDKSVLTFKGHKVLRTLIRCNFAPEFTTGQRYVYSGSADGRVYIYDLFGKIVQKCNTLQQVVRDVSWHPYHNYLVATAFRDFKGRIISFTHSGENELSRAHIYA